MTIPSIVLAALALAISPSIIGEPAPHDPSASPGAPRNIGQPDPAPLDPAYAPPDNAALLYYRYWMIADELLNRDDLTTWQTMHGWEPVPPELSRALETKQDAISGLLRATRIERADWGIEYDQGIGALLPHLSKLRQTARILAADGRRLLAAGEAERAAERLAAMYDMARQSRRDRILISSLVGLAIGAFANDQVAIAAESGRLTPEARRIILDAMDRIDPEDPAGVRGAILGERDIFLPWAKREFTGIGAGLRFANMMNALGDGDLSQLGRLALATMTEQALDAEIERAEAFYTDVLDVWEAEDAQERIAELAERVERGRYGLAAKLLVPAVEKIWQNVKTFNEDLAETRQALAEAPVAPADPAPEDDG